MDTDVEKETEEVCVFLSKLRLLLWLLRALHESPEKIEGLPTFINLKDLPNFQQITETNVTVKLTSYQN